MAYSELLDQPRALFTQVVREGYLQAPPRVVIPTARLPHTVAVDGSWFALITLEEVVRDGGALLQGAPEVWIRWDLWIGHEDDGEPVDAVLVLDSIETIHGGAAAECRDEGGLDLRTGVAHVHVDHATATKSVRLDPTCLVAALTALAEEVVGHTIDWDEAIRGAIRARDADVPDDLRPELQAAVESGALTRTAGWLPSTLDWRDLRATAECVSDERIAVAVCIGGDQLKISAQASTLATHIRDWAEERFGRWTRVTVTDPATGIEGDTEGLL